MACNTYENEQERLLQLWAEFDEAEKEGYIESENESDVGTDDDNVRGQEQESSEDIETDKQRELQMKKNEQEETRQEVEHDGNDEGSNTQDNNKAHRGKYFKGKDGTKWLNDCTNSRVRSRAKNIINHLPDVKRNTLDSKNSLDCWSLFIDNQIICVIARYTTNTN